MYPALGTVQRYPISGMKSDELYRLSIAEASARVASGDVAPTDIVESYISRVAARDDQVLAWASFDPEYARAQARELEESQIKGPLHGIPIGVKDIIDTADFPTERGSAMFRSRRSRIDASCVQLLRDAGAVLFGKTVTTEFAYFAPGPTRNPHNPQHTPGGSSSGSAASVADFQVPGALGTQTAGSVIRPASFNGILGFKPTYGLFSLDGVLPLASSLDTLGLFCRNIKDVSILGSVLSRKSRFASRPFEASPRIAVVRSPQWSQGSLEMKESFEFFVSNLRALGLEVVEKEFSILEGLAELQSSLLALEACETLGPLVDVNPSKIRQETKDLLESGRGLTSDIRNEINLRTNKARIFFREKVFVEADVVLTPAARGVAPRGLSATGDPLFNRIWTLLGLPCLSIPIGVGSNQLPLGVQIVGPYDQDEHLLACAPVLVDCSDYRITPP